MKIVFALFLTLYLFAFDESYLLGLKAYYDKNSSNDAQAIALLSKVAQKNNPDAAFLLGVAYTEGRVVAKDLKRSLYWYENAADLGDKDAMLVVGWYYYKGEVVKKDLQKAKYWFQKVANLGDIEALQMVELIDEAIVFQ